jgi:hypothetical protein
MKAASNPGCSVGRGVGFSFPASVRRIRPICGSLLISGTTLGDSLQPSARGLTLYLTGARAAFFEPFGFPKSAGIVAGERYFWSRFSRRGIGV